MLLFDPEAFPTRAVTRSGRRFLGGQEDGQVIGGMFFILFCFLCQKGQQFVAGNAVFVKCHQIKTNGIGAGFTEWVLGMPGIFALANGLGILVLLNFGLLLGLLGRLLRGRGDRR